MLAWNCNDVRHTEKRPLLEDKLVNSKLGRCEDEYKRTVIERVNFHAGDGNAANDHFNVGPDDDDDDDKEIEW